MTLFVLLSILLGAVLLGVLWAITTYNSLVRLKAYVDEGWSGIDVQLKRRYDLIPNLVAVVKQYSIHEKELLERVTQLRAGAAQAQSVEHKAVAEAELTGVLKTLFAVSENYPELKANENFMQLHTQLTAIEQDIQLSRRYYNGAARNYNISVIGFPRNLIAGKFGFEKAAYFEISAPERENPKVQF